MVTGGGLGSSGVTGDGYVGGEAGGRGWRGEGAGALGEKRERQGKREESYRASLNPFIFSGLRYWHRK